MRKHRVLAGILTAVMLLGTMPAALAASTRSSGEVAFQEQGNILLDKTAGSFNGSWETEVNLMVSSVTDQAPVAVEFVLDGTSSLYTTDNKVTIDEVAKQVCRSLYSKNAYVGVTVFGRTAKTVYPMSAVPAQIDANLSTETVTELMKPEQLGTNVQAGIQAGLADLNSGRAPENAKRFLVLITDGGSYWWLNDGQAVNNTVGGVPMQNSDAADGGYSADGTPLATLAQLQAAKPDANPYNHETTAGEALPDAVAAIKADGSIYTSFEKGVYFAAEELDKALADGVELITVSRPYYDTDASLAELTRLAGEFIAYANGKSAATADLTEDGIASVMKTVTDAATTVIRAGSTITDEIGTGTDNLKADYNFDVVTEKAVKLQINGASYTGVKSGNTWTFGDNSVLTYTAGAGEKLVLTLGQDLQRGQKLVLTYTAKLTNPSSESGTHTVYPNVQAVLVPYSSDDGLVFPRPALNYRVGGGGGGGGGTTPTKPTLNTTDHYAYIIGRKDGLVHPEAQITRAEVATIYFRMLTDESRTELWSQSNPYRDITPDMWCNAAISTMTRAGVIQGFQDGTFRPYAPITRAQFATIAVRFFEVVYEGDDKFSDIKDHWAADYINKAAEAAIIAGFQDGSFRPDSYITRAQAMTIFNRVLGRAPEKDHLLPGMITWPDNMDTSAWYYATMQEATNSHEYTKKTDADGNTYEVWTKLLPVRDWAAFEKQWADSNAAANPGEVISAITIKK